MTKEIFKITSAGSVDDGKSTILARLLLDTGSIYEDQLTKNIDPNKIADLLDGLESEREQGITIDVAHRFFDSKARRYQIADSPGHEQYTRNMATACAGSDALLLVVDATAGLKPQTVHHFELALRLGIREIIFAVNKMDLVNFGKKVFSRISSEIRKEVDPRSARLGGISHRVIPVSGLTGANVVKKSSRLSWFDGPSLVEAMDNLNKQSARSREGFFQVQLVQRLPAGGRRYLGPVVSGALQRGQRVFHQGNPVVIQKLYLNGVESEKANAGEQISLEIDVDLDVGRGDLISSKEINTHDQFEVDLIWLSESKGHKGRRYIVKSGSHQSSATITKINGISLHSNQKTGESQSVAANQIVRANISTSKKMALEPFKTNQELGRFILIDPEDGQTSAVGTVNFALRRSENITRHDSRVTTQMHEEITGNRGEVIWFTGLSGSGKSTLANKVSEELYKQSRPHFVLDGDNLRFGINRDLGFTEEDRTENIRRTAEIAALMADAGLTALVSLISPTEIDRQLARGIIGESRFTLIYVDTPLEVCESRDPKGLYKKARAGEIPNFTGVGSPFEEPQECLRAKTLEELVAAGILKDPSGN